MVAIFLETDMSEQRIADIIGKFSDADEEMVSDRVNKFYDPRKQLGVEVAIANMLQGYFDGQVINSVINSDDMQIRIDTMLRDVAYHVAAREYAIEIDNQNIEGKENE
ncbi:hypothetical protein PQD17_gp44 [Pantoea phage PdC23]|uniref:Uncharacterized protein n=1 Tax=Pantoea phage PdC23 TaxID=2894356 RepID=A0AAE8YHI7_9CAUD|nr:hypothetical protein PQD17_gp44 [Pantoea phage PdC23]UGC97757.1 hypothetical protein pdc_044 [Pantoea phage PdC23]